VTAPDAEPRSESAIEISGLEFGYDETTKVVAIDQMQIGITEKVFLFGPSGSGKSTLLSLIGGILRPQAGRVSVLGQSLSSKGAARDRFRADHIGFIFQQFNLVPYLSVDDNVCLPCRYSARRFQRASDSDGSPARAAARLLEALGIGERHRARRSTDLSVGQQQRVAVARALIGRPELVIADEPTSALDTNLRREFIDLLLSECERSASSVMFVSHDASLARHFDRAIDLETVNAAAGVQDDG